MSIGSYAMSIGSCPKGQQNLNISIYQWVWYPPIFPVAQLLPECVCMCAHSLSHLLLFVTPWTTVHLPFQEGILEWVAVSYSRESSQPKDWSCISWVSCTGRSILHYCPTWKAPQSSLNPTANITKNGFSLYYLYIFKSF